MPNDWIRATPSGTRIDLRVIPRAHKDAIDGLRHESLLVRVRAAPTDGDANEAVIALLARTLGVPRRAIRLLSGETSRHKTVEIAGLAPETATARLRRAVPP